MNCLDVLKHIADNSIDLIVTDPPYHCFDKQTKVKTKRGFIYFEEITKDDEVLSCDLNTMELHYVKIKNIIKRKVNEDLVQLKTKGIDLLVTKEHRMVALREHWQNRTQYNLITSDNGLCFAKNIKKSYVMPRTGYKFRGDNIEYFTLPSIELSLRSAKYDYSEKQIPIKEWLQFFGFWLADGYVRESIKPNSKKQKYSVGIKQKEGINEKYLDNIFEKLPFNFSKYYGKDGKISYEIYNKQLWAYMSQFGNSYNKFVPRWIKDLDIELLKVFYNSYKLGDITINHNSRVISSVSEKLLDDLWEIELKLGRLTNINYSKNLYSFNVAQESKMHKYTYPEPKFIPYNDYVYCVELEKYGTLFVDRNGKRAICGNCTPRGNAGNSGGMLQKDINKKGKVFACNDISVGDYAGELYRVLKDGGHCYIMTNHVNLIEMLNTLTGVGFHFIKSLIWNKGNKIMGQYYMSQYEYILFFRKGKGVRIRNCGTPDILSVPNKKTKDENGKNIHDTEKPVELMRILIENSSDEGDIVLDPFMGSGSTGIAATELNRDFIGSELDDKYYELSVTRIPNDKKCFIGIDIDGKPISIGDKVKIWGCEDTPFYYEEEFIAGLNKETYENFEKAEYIVRV